MGAGAGAGLERRYGNARRRMAAFRICLFLHDATCNPRLEAKPMDMTTG